VESLFARLTARVRRAPAAPFLTWYGVGARVELSAATFGNAVAKTAGFLVDEAEAAPGDSIRLDLDRHWQLPVWVAACDAVGLDVLEGPGGSPTALVATIHPDRQDDAERILVSATPFGLPGEPAGPGFLDHARLAPGQPDVFTGPAASGRLWHRGQWLSGTALIAAAEAEADRAGLEPGGRLEVWPDHAQPALACFAVPLVRSASVVLVADPDADTTAERVTARL
jgi:uncharacterized protein (TIGR03089 family)